MVAPVKSEEMPIPEPKIFPDVGERLRLELARSSPGTYDLCDALVEAANAMESAIRCWHPMSHGYESRFGGAWVYVVHAPLARAVKIGTSARGALAGRMRRIQAGTPEKLSLVALARGSTELESQWHFEHKASRRHAEWFCDLIEPFFSFAMAKAAPHGCARCALVGDQNQ